MAETQTTYAKNLNTVISWDTDFVYMNLVYKNTTSSYSIDAVYKVDHDKLKNTIQPNNNTYCSDIFYDIDSTYYTTLSYTLSILDKNYNKVELKYPIKILNYPAHNVFVDTHELQLYNNAITYIYATATNGTNETYCYVNNVTPLISTNDSKYIAIYPTKLVENNNLLPNKLSNYKLSYAYMYKISYSEYYNSEYFDFKPISNIDSRITERVYIDNKNTLPISHNTKNITDNVLYDLNNIIYTNSNYNCNVNNLFDIETRINDTTMIKKLSDGIKNNAYFSIQLNKNIYLPEYYVTVKNESNVDEPYVLTNLTYIQNSNMYDIYRYDLRDRKTNKVVATAYSSKTYSYPVLKNQHNIEYNINKLQGEIGFNVKCNNDIKISYAYSINNFILNDKNNLFNAKSYITYCAYQYSYYPGPSEYSYDYDKKRYNTSNNCIQLCIGDNEFINRDLDNIYVIKDDEFIVNDSFIWNKSFIDNYGNKIDPDLNILSDNIFEFTSDEQNNINNFVLNISSENSFNNVFNSIFDVYVHKDGSVIFRLKTNIYNISYFKISYDELTLNTHDNAKYLYNIINSNDIQKYNVEKLFFDSIIYITKEEQDSFNYIFVVELNIENNSNIKNILVLQSKTSSYRQYDVLNMGISNNFLLSNKFDNVVYAEYMSDDNRKNYTYVGKNIEYINKAIEDNYGITVDDIYLNKLYNCCDNEFYLVNDDTDIIINFPNNTVTRHGDHTKQELVYKKYSDDSKHCLLLQLGNNNNAYYNFFKIYKKSDDGWSFETTIQDTTYKWMFSYNTVCRNLFDHYYNNDNIYQIMHYDWHANSYINTFDVKDIKKSRQYINSECDNKVLNYSDIAHNTITDDIIGLYKTVEDFNGLNFEASYTNIFSLRPIIKTVNLYNYDIVKNYTMVINDRFINDNIIKYTDTYFKEYYNLGDFEFKLNIDTRNNLLSFNICVLFIYIDNDGHEVYLVWDNDKFKILTKSINNTLSVKINYYSQKITMTQSKYCERDARRDPSRDKKDKNGNTLYAWFCEPITITHKDKDLKQTLNSITLYSSKINLKPHFDTLLDINTSIQHTVIDINETTNIGVFTIPIIHNNYDDNVNYVMLNEIFNYINKNNE